MKSLLRLLLATLALTLSSLPLRADQPSAPDLTFLPRTVGEVQIVAWDGFSYVTATGRTYWSGASTPSAADLDDALATPRTQPAPPVAPHRILKDTIIQRVKAANKLAELRAIIAGLDADARFEWDNSSWFSSNNALLLGGVQGLGLDPAVILAPDPLAP